MLKYSSFLLNYLLKVIICCYFPFKHRERNYSLKGTILMIINLQEKILNFSDIIQENEVRSKTSSWSLPPQDLGPYFVKKMYLKKVGDPKIKELSQFSCCFLSVKEKEPGGI